MSSSSCRRPFRQSESDSTAGQRTAGQYQRDSSAIGWPTTPPTGRLPPSTAATTMASLWSTMVRTIWFRQTPGDNAAIRFRKVQTVIRDTHIGNFAETSFEDVKTDFPDALRLLARNKFPSCSSFGTSLPMFMIRNNRFQHADFSIPIQRELRAGATLAERNLLAHSPLTGHEGAKGEVR